MGEVGRAGGVGIQGVGRAEGIGIQSVGRMGGVGLRGVGTGDGVRLLRIVLQNRRPGLQPICGH